MLFICYLWRLFCLQQEIMHSMLWASVCHRDKKAKKNEKKNSQEHTRRANKLKWKITRETKLIQ